MPSCTSAAPERCFQQLNQAGQPSPLPADNISWSQEAALDLAMASAICPSCKLVLVHANSNSWDDVSTAVATAGRSGAHAISNSYGAAESRLHAPYEQTYNIPGVAVTVSTGDAGYGVSFPASSPHVVAVGGTRLNEKPSNSRGWTETVWSGTGSGCSTVFAKPSWQTDSGCGKRTVGDVAAVADPNTGVSVYWNGPGDGDDLDWYVFGGTSVRRTDHRRCLRDQWRSGELRSRYLFAGNRLERRHGRGRTGAAKKKAYLCTAAAGYDGPTGHGSLNGIKAVGGGTTS